PEPLDLELVEPRRAVDIVRQLRALAGRQLGDVRVGRLVGLLAGGEHAADVVAVNGNHGFEHLAGALEDACLLPGLDVDRVDVRLGQRALAAAVAVAAGEVHLAGAGDADDAGCSRQEHGRAEHPRAGAAASARRLLVVFRVLALAHPLALPRAGEARALRD